MTDRKQHVAEFQQFCDEVADLLDRIEDPAIYRELRNAFEILSIRLMSDWSGFTVAFHKPIPDDASGLF